MSRNGSPGPNTRIRKASRHSATPPIISIAPIITITERPATNGAQIASTPARMSVIPTPTAIPAWPLTAPSSRSPTMGVLVAMIVPFLFGWPGSPGSGQLPCVEPLANAKPHG